MMEIIVRETFIKQHGDEPFCNQNKGRVDAATMMSLETKHWLVVVFYTILNVA